MARENQRKTVYNQLVTEEKLEFVAAKNRRLLADFLSYCKTNDKSEKTIYQYQKLLEIFFVWNNEENGNCFFTKVRKRDFVRFLGYGRGDLGWSSARLAMAKSSLSSLSNYIVRVLDDEYPEFKNLLTSLEPIRIEKVREKTVLTMEQIENTLQELVKRSEYQLACYLSLLVSSGMRKAESLQMKVDFFKEENVVFDIMYKTPKIRTKGRGAKGKQVPRYIFKYEFAPYLEKWLKQREELEIDNEYLFVTKIREGWIPAKISTANRWAEELSEIMGIDMYGSITRYNWIIKLAQQKYPFKNFHLGQMLYDL